MHDMIGSAGMLRGWVAVWTWQMVWFAATMTATVGATAMLELLFTGHARRPQATPRPQEAVADVGDLQRPLA